MSSFLIDLGCMFLLFEGFDSEVLICCCLYLFWPGVLFLFVLHVTGFLFVAVFHACMWIVCGKKFNHFIVTVF